MLKIKEYDDNGNKIDLKELEKYGFKSKYDEDTGELLYMYFLGKFKTFGGDQSYIKIYKKRECFFKRLINIKKDKDYHKDIRNIETYASKSSSPFDEIAEKLYDLIKADLVEKVEE